MRLQPYFIGIAGPSCSGKSDVARRVAEKLGASIIGLDSYYRELTGVPRDRRARVNFDAPESLDHELLYAQVHRLATGHPIDKPVYDFTTDSRSTEIDHVPVSDFVIVEGLFALHWTDLRKLFRTKVYISASHDVCFERRLARDVAERGRTPESVERQYRDTVRPMCEKYVVPTKHFADLLLSGTSVLDESAERVVSHVLNHLTVKTPQPHVIAVTA